MQRLLVSALVVLAVALSAGGVAVSVRADSAQRAPIVAPSQDQCTPVHGHPTINAQAAELAAKDDIVPLNTQGYNYDAYEDQWHPDASAAAPAAGSAVPASPAKP